MPIGIILLLAGVSALLMVPAVPLIQRRVPPNVLYGLRVPATLADEWVWYEANARSGWELLTLGALLFVLTFALLALPVSHEAQGLIWAAVAVAGALATGILGWVRANRLLRNRPKTGAPSTSTSR